MEFKEESILTDTVNGLGIITLNSPETQNALTLENIRLLDATLEAWKKDDQVHMVLLQAKGEVFCSGADLKLLYPELNDRHSDLTRDYFREEYILNRHIHHYPKPWISILNGEVDGDGIGLALFGSHRIVTEKASFHLSETDMGFIADGGATYYLSRFPGRSGWYVGLTGLPINAGDAIYTGLGTHYMSETKAQKLQEQLSAGGFSTNARAELDEVLKPYIETAPDSELKAHQRDIDYCFAFSTIEEVMYNLAQGGSDWHLAALDAMKKHSPTSLKATHRLIKAGRRMDFDEALQLEYRLSQHMMRHPDFKEGIRAHIIDKDHNPAWLPDMPEAVSTAMIDQFFEPLPEGELRLKLSLSEL